MSADEWPDCPSCGSDVAVCYVQGLGEFLCGRCDVGFTLEEAAPAREPESIELCERGVPYSEHGNESATIRSCASWEPVFCRVPLYIYNQEVQS